MTLLKIDEKTTFDRLEVGGELVTGHFRLKRAVGSLAYVPALFVVEEGGEDRCWPLTAVTCLWPN